MATAFSSSGVVLSDGQRCNLYEVGQATHGRQMYFTGTSSSAVTDREM